MALNQIERAILTAARQYIADGRELRICHAINRGTELVGLGVTTHQFEKVNESGTRLRRFIMREIKVDGDSVFGLEDWICNKLPGCGARVNVERMHATRLAWIDWLLDEPWTDHNGGPCPLLPTEKVIVRCRNGDEKSVRPADCVRWHNASGESRLYQKWATNYDVVAYKVIYEAPNAQQIPA